MVALLVFEIPQILGQLVRDDAVILVGTLPGRGTAADIVQFPLNTHPAAFDRPDLAFLVPGRVVGIRRKRLGDPGNMPVAAVLFDDLDLERRRGNLAGQQFLRWGMVVVVVFPP